MLEISLVGIGTGNPEHLTLQAVRVLNEADVILIPRKGTAKDELAEVRRTIVGTVLTNAKTVLKEFDLPVRNPDITDYQERVNKWHDEIAKIWHQEMRDAVGSFGKVAFLIWGDPGLYDSSLRIAARLTEDNTTSVQVIPGITAIQGLTAAHAIPLNQLAEPFLVTTGRRLKEDGWPEGIGTVVVMLDGESSFQFLDAEKLAIWWGAYVGMEKQIIIKGSLTQNASKIIETRAKARAAHGWIMDIYILRQVG